MLCQDDGGLRLWNSGLGCVVDGRWLCKAPAEDGEVPPVYDDRHAARAMRASQLQPQSSTSNIVSRTQQLHSSSTASHLLLHTSAPSQQHLPQRGASTRIRAAARAQDTLFIYSSSRQSMRAAAQLGCTHRRGPSLAAAPARRCSRAAVRPLAMAGKPKQQMLVRLEAAQH